MASSFTTLIRDAERTEYPLGELRRRSELGIKNVAVRFRGRQDREIRGPQFHSAGL